jgi:hypothetical protein
MMQVSSTIEQMKLTLSGQLLMCAAATPFEVYLNAVDNPAPISHEV